MAEQCQQCLEHAELHKDLFGITAFGKQEPCRQCEAHLALHSAASGCLLAVLATAATALTAVRKLR